MKAFWFNQAANVGDVLTPWLIERLLGAPAEWCEPDGVERVLLLAGSLLTPEVNLEGTVVIGTGAMLGGVELRGKPAHVVGVRGPMTRQLLLDNGIACPSRFFDPAQWLPLLYQPIEPAHKTALGVVPHYIDAVSPWVAQAKEEGARIIDVGAPVEKFVDALVSCARIVTSSLHGYILAEAYGLPVEWVELSDKVAGERFKFYDWGLRGPAHTIRSDKEKS